MISKSFYLRSIGSFKTTDDEVGKKKTDEGRSGNGGYNCDEEVTQQYHHDVFSPYPNILGPRQRSAFDRLPKEGGVSPRSEGAVNSTRGKGRSSGSRDLPVSR